MTLSLIFLIAGWSMLSGASRLKYVPSLQVFPDTAAGYMMAKPAMLHTSSNLPHIQMTTSFGQDDDSRELGSNASRMGLTPGWYPHTWRGAIDTRVSQQQFPPSTATYGLDARELLDDWTQVVIDPNTPNDERASHYNRITQFAELRKTAGWQTSIYWQEREKPIHWQEDKAIALQIMRDVVAEATSSHTFTHYAGVSRLERLTGEKGIRSRALYLLLSSGQLEMVGLIEKNLVLEFLESRSSAVDAHVLGLGVFSRGQLKDDNMGSLRNVVEALYGKDGNRPWNCASGFADIGAKVEFDVFAIEGLADAPGFSERSARILLSKIEKYAHKEQKIVVVPKWARMSSDGRDLTDYYVRLGFEKVEIVDGQDEYVYTGRSYLIEEKWVENQQIMVGMNLWAGISQAKVAAK